MTNYITPLHLYTPSPHKFYSVRLVSGIWDNKSNSELLLELSNKTKENEDNRQQLSTSLEPLEILNRKPANLKEQLELNRLMSFYSSFFDEDSGNTKEEGINQLKNYLDEESKLLRQKAYLSQKYLDDLKKEIDIRSSKK